MTESTTQTTKGPLPPYIAFKTLVDIVERMEREEPPTRVDPTYLDSYAGGYRPTVISNLQTLGLLKKTGEPTETLLALVIADEAERKNLIAQLLKTQYSDVFVLGTNSTQGQFLEVFSHRGAQGDTRRKAVSFFLKGCTYADLATGTHWKTPPASTSGTKRKATPRRDALEGEKDRADEQKDVQPRGEDVATVRLRSGGTLTLALDGNSLVMPKDDRNFVFSIVDLMQEYEQRADNSPSATIKTVEENA